MEGIRLVNAVMAAYMHPSRAGDVPQSVLELLNSLLLRFSDEFDGVVLAHLKPKILSRTAKILSGLSPYFHVKLTTKLLLFSPTPGMKIEGKVNKIEQDYIGVLVLGIFNSTIGVVDIRQEFTYQALRDGRRFWASDATNDHVIGLGSLIRFTVKSLQETEHIIDMCGSLKEDDTGCVQYLDCSSSKSKKKSKQSNSRPLESEDRKLKKQKKEKKHRKLSGQELQQQILELNEMVPSSIQGPPVTPKLKKGKGLDQIQNFEQVNHKSKRSKGEAEQSKQSNPRPFESEDRKHKKSKKHKKSDHLDAQELQNHPQTLHQHEAVPSSVQSHQVVKKHKKRKEKGQSQSPEEVQNSKRRKGEVIV